MGYNTCMNKIRLFYTCILFWLGLSAAFTADFSSDFSPFSFTARAKKGSDFDVSYMNKPVDESQRVVIGQDGHLYSNGKRIRIFGTNLSAFPQKEDAAYWAEVLANQGINCVRFHHTDSSWAHCFFKRNSNGKYVFDESAFDRFDLFFYELKKRGVYSNINLLTGRSVAVSDKLPAQLNSVKDWKDRHLFGFWDQRGVEDQKKYAEKILTHKNPYTGLSYAEDPAVIFVEINNENSMLKGYFDGALDRYPENLKEGLLQKWTDYLNKKGLSYQKLNASYNKSNKLSSNLLSGRVNLEQYEGAKADFTSTAFNSKIKVLENGKQGWHIQLDYFDFTTEENQLYTIKFKARASAESAVSASVMMNHSPWKDLGFSKKFEVGKEWKEYTFTFLASADDDKPRLTFGDMGLKKGITFDFKDISLCKGGELITIGQKGKYVDFPGIEDFKRLPLELRYLIVDFMREIDADYWKKMNDYLKKDLAIKAHTFGTTITCDSISSAAIFDVIDNHAYWNHPSFPNDSWNASDFYVKNKSLLKAEDGGTLTELAASRIFGKVFSVTEYDHPYPNQFSSEMLPMLSVFASLQDWDCIYTFCYDVSQKNPETARINGYFDQDSNPAKIAALPMAAKIFREFLIEPFEEKRSYNVSLEKEVEVISKIGMTWNVTPAGGFGCRREDAFKYQLGGILDFDQTVAVEGKQSVAENQNGAAAGAGSGHTSRKEKSQLYWKAQKGYFIFTNKDVFVSVSLPQNTAQSAALAQSTARTPEQNFTDLFQTEGIPLNSEICILPGQDFASFCAVKSAEKGGEKGGGKWIIFSSSWSGNSGEKLREYGSPLPASGRDEGNKAKSLRTLDDIKLTSSYTENGQKALALGSYGQIKTKLSKGRLYKVLADGRKGDLKGDLKGELKDNLTLYNDEGCLWYLLEE